MWFAAGLVVGVAFSLFIIFAATAMRMRLNAELREAIRREQRRYGREEA